MFINTIQKTNDVCKALNFVKNKVIMCNFKSANRIRYRIRFIIKYKK